MPQLEGSSGAAFQARGYRIERELGRGGMATVYLAHDIKHGRQVALKVLSPEVGSLRVADRFAAEIRVTAKLQHPNILPLFDSGSVDGLLYYAMPYVEGGSLRGRLQRQKQLSVPDTVKLISALASALEHAHVAGVLHRDIKPENILLQDGRPVLADFGIALALSSAGVERITATGLTLGTPQYMSPEQAAGELGVGPASDVYSLAAVAYEMLTGEPPFTGPNIQAVLARVMLESPRPIRTIRSTVPASIEAAILKALAKHPVDRFASAADFEAAIHALAGREPAWDRFRRFLPRPAVAASVALFTIALVGGALVSRPSPNRPIASAASANRIAVFPFMVQGGPELAYLANGLMDLVSEAVDGAGELRRVDPMALTGHLRPDANATIDLDRARDAASHFGAARYVLGNVTSLGDELRIAASLYDSRRGDAPVTVASASGKSERVAELANELARQLLSSTPVGPGPVLKDVSTVRTTNFTAFKAYLKGEALFRRGLFDSAGAKLYQAVTADSNFAIAWYRLSRATGMGGGPRLVVGVPTTRESIDRAYSLRDRLSPRDSLIVAIQWAFHHADVDRAEELAQEATGLYPDLAEGWHLLASVRTRYGWQRGRPLSEAREPLNRTLALDSGYPPAIVEARGLALYERRYADARALSGKTPMRTNGYIDSQRRVVAFVLGDAATRDTFANGLQGVDDVGYYWTAWQLAIHTDSVDAARQLWKRFEGATDRTAGLRSGRRRICHDDRDRGPQDEPHSSEEDALASMRPVSASASRGGWAEVIAAFGAAAAAVAG